MHRAPLAIAQFAKQILFSAEIEAKLQPPSRLAQQQAEPEVALTEIPDAPARPANLRLPERGTHDRVLFPKDGALTSPLARATVLHFFANHELLALELMATALLRFPEAPKAFRRGLVATMLDEQKHFSLYVARLRELGLDFGAVPVNRYFWDVMAHAPSPLVFVTQMALTFEQANLDYSRYYRDLFAAVGDHETAWIMDLVYHEEIAHVRHGQVWFDTFRPGVSDAWTEYCQLLPAPMTPHKAKGKVFYADARLAAGISPEFTQELAAVEAPVYKRPSLYWFNPGFEAESAGDSGTPPKILREVTADLSSLLLCLVAPEDIVYTPLPMRQEFLAELRGRGLTAASCESDLAALKQITFSSCVPWGRSAAAMSWLAQMGLRSVKEVPPTPAELCSKAWAKAVLNALQPDGDWGEVCLDLEAAVAAIARYTDVGASGAVVKAPFGTAGRGQRRFGDRIDVATGESRCDIGAEASDVAVSPDMTGRAQRRNATNLSANERQWLQGTLEAQGALIVEPWRDKLADFSVQLRTDGHGRPVLGITRFFTDARGQYLGHYLGAKFADLPQAVLRAYHELDGPAQLTATGEAVAARLSAAGYHGPAGVDALLYQDGSRYGLYPLVEINTRMTMGRIALALDTKIHPRAPARWAHMSLKRVRTLGFADFPSFAAALAAVPTVTTADKLSSGAFATNDPQHAKTILTVVLVGPAALAIAGF